MALADWAADGKLTVYSPNQNSFAFRIILSDIFGLPYSKIRVAAPAIGGAFGGKLEVTIEPVAAVLSRMRSISRTTINPFLCVILWTIHNK